eukprot:scaffold2737_cov156-Amphora_coffeaeformis.AAC.4
MTRTLGSQFAESSQVLRREIVAGQMQHGVLQGTGVSIGQDKAITIDPGRILARVLHVLGPKQISHGGASHGGPGMSRVGRLGLIGRHGTNRVDRESFQIRNAHVVVGIGFVRG